MKKTIESNTPPKKKKPQMSKCVREVDANLGLGALSLVNKRITSLEGLGVQKTLVKLYLQNNCLENFEFLNSQPHLKELYVQNNFIKSFKGLELQPALNTLGLAGNPVCAQAMCRVMALLAVGPTLRKIDDDMLSQVERMTASRLSPKAAIAIRLGGIIDYKRRSDEDFDEMIDQLSGKQKIKIEGKPNLVPSTPPPAYSPPKSEEPRIAIIYKGKPQLPKKATETDEDQAHEALILRTLKQIEDADLADDEFVVEVDDEDDDFLNTPHELNETNNDEIEQKQKEEKEREEKEAQEHEVEEIEDKEEDREGEIETKKECFDFNLSQTLPIPQTPPQPHLPPQLPPLPLHNLHHYNNNKTSNNNHSSSPPSSSSQNNNTDVKSPNSAYGKDEGKVKTPKSHTPKTVDRDLALLKEQVKEMDQLRAKLKEMEKLKERVKLLEKSVKEEREAKLQYNESLLQETSHRMKVEGLLDEEREKSNSLADHLAELTDRCNDLIDNNERLKQENLEVVEMSTQSLLAEREQRKLIEEKYEEKNSPTKGGRKSGDTEFVSVKDMCNIDTIQFYTVIRKESQNISACISFHDDGISLMNTETAQAMEFPLKSDIDMVRDNETMMTLFGNNHEVTLNDKRIDLIAQLISFWLTYKK